MPSKKIPRDPSPTSPASFSWTVLGPWREAAVLFLLASAFAVLFNAFYAGGIELKVKPKVYRGIQGAAAPRDYAGWKDTGKGPSRPRGRPGTGKSAVPSEADAIPRLSLQGAYRRFKDRQAVFLDARKPEEYAEGHIPGALNFYGNELDRFAPVILPQLPDKTQAVVAYCHGGDCDLSLQVAKTLKEQGYSRVTVFQDGWPAWKKAGYPVQEGDRP